MATLVLNEGRWLPEWILWHRGVGIDHFYMYDDGSSDNTVEVLSYFQDAGLVTLHQDMKRIEDAVTQFIPRGALFRPQIAMVQHAALNYVRDTEWLAFFDPDEFLVPMVSPCLSQMVDSAPPEVRVERVLPCPR